MLGLMIKLTKLEAAPALVQLHLHLMAFTNHKSPQARESNVGCSRGEDLSRKIGGNSSKLQKLRVLEGIS